MDKNSFVMYTEHYEYIKELDMNQRGLLLTAIYEYQSGEKIEAELDPVAAMVFKFMKKMFDIDAVKYFKQVEANKANGSKGGRPPKSKSEENPNNPMLFPKTEENPNKANGFSENPEKHDSVSDNDSDSGNDNNPLNPPQAEENGDENRKPPKKSRKSAKDEKNEELKQELNQIFTSQTAHFTDNLRNKVKEWIEYKRTEKGDNYQPIGLRNLLAEIDNNRKRYGELAVIEVISYTISNLWKGITWDKIEKNKGGSQYAGHNSGISDGSGNASPGSNAGEYASKIKVTEY